MPIHLQASDVDVIDAGGDEGMEVPLCRRATAEMVAPTPVDIEGPGPWIDLATAAANSALDGGERQQQAHGNAGCLGGSA
jgi:hypothetical protein